MQNNNENINRSIECSVTNCAHHAGNADYCCLNCVHIGSHENNPTMSACTDCKSYQPKQPQTY